MCLRVALLMLLSAFVAAAQSNVSNVSSAGPGSWVGTWAASPFDGDPWHGVPTLVDSTLREIVHTSVGGNAVRVHLTNEFGKEPLRVDAVTVAVSAGTSSSRAQYRPARTARWATGTWR